MQTFGPRILIFTGTGYGRDDKYSVKIADFLIIVQFINDNRFDSEEFV